MNRKQPVDEDVLDEMRRGDAQALAILFDRYGRLVFQIAKQILRDDGEAEDLAQEVFLEVYQKAELYDSSRGSVKVWLLQYAYHRGFNRRKYLGLRRFYDDSPAAALAEAQLAGESKGREGLTSQEWQQVLQRALLELNPNERRIIGMVAFDGLTVREAAGQIKESYMNGRNLYYRGLKKLRQFLGNPSPGREVDDVRS